jgi:FlaA1/EpsC-like NDP-sugar epimerase
MRSEADIFLSNNIKLLMLNRIEEFNAADTSVSNVSTHVKNIKIEDLLSRDPIINNNPQIAATTRDKTVLITGAAGSIGSEIVRQIASYHPGRIILLDQAETPMHELQLELEHNFNSLNKVMCIADVANYDRLNEIFSKYRPQVVYHAAAYKHVPMMEANPVEAVVTNIFGSKNVADLSMRYGAEKFVMISTDKAVNPTNIMGASKRIAEIYVQSLALNIKNEHRAATNFITTRFGNVLGSNGSVIPLFRKQIAEGGPVTVTHRDIIRYFMTIPEACSLVLEAGCMGNGGEIYIFDMGKPVKIYDLACRMISLSGLRPETDIKIIETGLRPGEKLYEELLNEKELTTATQHKKIMIAKVRTYDYADVCASLNTLYNVVKTHNTHDIVAQMKAIVPEYKSQNSEFESIDKEITEHSTIK